jgi:hypothetical protein
MQKIKVGVIGCGMVANSYLNTLQKFAHVEFGACADLMQERAEQVAAEYGFQRACSVDELLAGDDSDLVLNLTIPAVHCEVNLAILESGKHVYSEKPLGIKLEEAQQVLAKAKEKGLRVGCAPDTFLAGAQQQCRQLDVGSGGLCDHGATAVVRAGKDRLGSRADWRDGPHGAYRTAIRRKDRDQNADASGVRARMRRRRHGQFDDQLGDLGVETAEYGDLWHRRHDAIAALEQLPKRF